MLPNYLVEMRKFVAPEFIYGLKAIDLVCQYASNLGMNKVLLVADPGVIEAGWADRVRTSLSADDIGFVVFDGISPTVEGRLDQVLKAG